MRIISNHLSPSFGMAKIVNKTKIWETVAEQMNTSKVANKIMQGNLECIEAAYPDKYLHTYEFGDSVTFKISSIKNHFLTYFISYLS